MLVETLKFSVNNSWAATENLQIFVYLHFQNAVMSGKRAPSDVSHMSCSPESCRVPIRSWRRKSVRTQVNCTAEVTGRTANQNEGKCQEGQTRAACAPRTVLTNTLFARRGSQNFGRKITGRPRSRVTYRPTLVHRSKQKIKKHENCMII